MWRSEVALGRQDKGKHREEKAMMLMLMAVERLSNGTNSVNGVGEKSAPRASGPSEGKSKVNFGSLTLVNYQWVIEHLKKGALKERQTNTGRFVHFVFNTSAAL